MSELNRSIEGKRALVIGGAGFIGSHVVSQLVSVGAEVLVLDSLYPEYGGNVKNLDRVRGRIEFIHGDMRDEALLSPLLDGAEIVINMAGQTSHLDSMRNPKQDLSVNVEAQLTLLELCRAKAPDARIVFASTRQVYGRPQYLPVDEKHLLVPVDINGIHKIAGEHYHSLYHSVYGLKTTSLRLTNTIGPGMRIKDAKQTFLGVWIRRVLEGEPILVFGDGLQRRDFNSVHDVARAVLTVVNSPAAIGRIYNLGSNEVISLAELASLLCMVAKSHSRFEPTWNLVPFPDDLKAIDIGDYYGSFAKIKEELSWSPQKSLREMLEEMLIYYSDRLIDYV